jgi:hypothetical protein
MIGVDCKLSLLRGAMSSDAVVVSLPRGTPAAGTPTGAKSGSPFIGLG